VSYTKTLVAALLIQSLCVAQGASFKTFGSGCPGSSSSTCPSNNANATKLENRVPGPNPQLALEIDAITPVISGFELFTQAQSKVTVKAWILLPDAQGLPNSSKPLATGSITFDTKLGWYRATFPSSVLLGNASHYFISWEPSQGSAKSAADPVVHDGTKSPHYQRLLTQRGFRWVGPSTDSWAWKINCTASKQVPAIANSGDPSLGNTKFKLLLTRANANLAAAAIIGSSNTTWGSVKLPLDLSGIGANGCSLLVSLDLLFGSKTDKNGTAELPLSIPKDTALKGKSFYAQWLVFDQSANAFGIVLSDGAIATVGDAS